MTDRSAAATVRLDVFSDYTCPWCYVGWARLEKALAHVAEHISVSVRWRPFEIHPEVPAEGMPVEALPYSPEQWARMQEALASAAAEEGLEVGRRPKVSNTHSALAAAEHVWHEQRERFGDFHEALFKGYFAVGLDLGDVEVLRDLARACGIDADRMQQALDDGRHDAALRATSEEAGSLGITGTPTFLFDGRFVAVGAQPTEVLIRGIEELAGQGGSR